MTPEKLGRLRPLQEAVRLLGGREHMLPEDRAELELLERELALEQQEKPDDPKTWLTDESSRPLLDGSNYNDTLKAMCWDEVGNFAKLAIAKFGAPLVEAAFAAALKR